MLEETFSSDSGESATLRKDWTDPSLYNGEGYPKEAAHSFQIRILVAGTRKYNDYEQFKTLITKCLTLYANEPIIFISGKAATGADKLIIDYCKENKLPWVEFPADWDQHGKSAGYIRNKEMGDIATDLITFWDGRSPGTKNMIDVSKEKNLHVKTFLVSIDK